MARDVSAYLHDIYDACVAIDERLFLSISNSRAIIDFRNLLAHDYGAVDDDSVFGLVYSDLVVLKEEVGNLLHDLFGAN
jgi:uncharacterized protein with HEPN domain